MSRSVISKLGDGQETRMKTLADAVKV